MTDDVRGGWLPQHVLAALLFLSMLSVAHAPADAEWIPAGLSGERVRGLVSSRTGVRFAATTTGLSRSADGGTTWQLLEPGLFNDAFSVVAARDSNQVFIAVETGVYRTDDDGATWQHLGDEVTGAYSLGISPTGDVWASGSGGTLRSTDRGLHWSTLHPTAGSFSDGIGFDISGRVFVVTIFADCVRSLNQGATWDTLTPSSEFKTSITVSRRTGTVLVATQNFDTPSLYSVYRSTNHGDTWQRVVHGAGSLDVVAFLDDGTAVVGPEATMISQDDGLTWNPLDVGQPSFTEAHCFVAVDGVLYAGFGNEGLWREDRVTVSTSPPAAESAGALALTLVRNPVVGQCRLRFVVPSATAVRLDLHDARGRRVANLFDGAAGPGTHHVAFDLVRLPPGVYFGRLAAGRNVVTTKIVAIGR